MRVERRSASSYVVEAMNPDSKPPLTSQFVSMDERSRLIFDEIVRIYLETGEPVGSRTVSRRGFKLSPASIRNVMSDLTEMGLLASPHISAGRLPTPSGLRLFVDGLMEVGRISLSEDDRRHVDQHMSHLQGGSPEEVMGGASEFLSGIAGGAGLVSSPKREAPVRHVDFLPIADDKALAVIVTEDGDLENRLLDLPPGLPASALQEARNYLNARMMGKTLAESRESVNIELGENRAQLDVAASKLVEQGLAQWTGEDPLRGRSLIVRGRANLIEDARAAEDVDRVKKLFEDLDKKENLLRVLDRAQEAEGVRLFIGGESNLFSLSGSATIVAPYMNAERKLVGALGVIGPTRLNYARVIPLVDYTARIVGQLLDGRSVTGGKDNYE